MCAVPAKLNFSEIEVNQKTLELDESEVEQKALERVGLHIRSKDIRIQSYFLIP